MTRWDTPWIDDRPPLGIVAAAPPPLSAETISLRFRTAREIGETTPESPDWIVPGLLAVGAITELDGKAKSAGKTTFVTHMIRAILDGQPFLNLPTRKTPVLYLTEQSIATFREPLRRADLLDRIDLWVLSWPDARNVPWPAVMAASVVEAKRIAAEVIVVDTLPQYAGMRGDAENSAGAALQAVEPLQAAAAEGMAVLVTRHERKSGGEIGDSARGSSAFGGSVDIILQLSRAEGQGDPSIRMLKGTGRYDETPAQVAIQLREGVGYTVLGDQAAASFAIAETAILTNLPKSPDAAMTITELMNLTGDARNTTQRVLDSFVGKAIVERLGAGKRGDPYRYWQRLTPAPFVSAELAVYRAAESFSGSSELIPSASDGAGDRPAGGHST